MRQRQITNHDLRPAVLIVTFIVSALIASSLETLDMRLLALLIFMVAGGFAAWGMYRLGSETAGRRRFHYRLAAGGYAALSVLAAILYAISIG